MINESLCNNIMPHCSQLDLEKEDLVVIYYELLSQLTLTGADALA